MGIVGGFDIHRREITYDYVDDESGEVSRGRVTPADREHVWEFLGRFSGCDKVNFAVEGCTGCGTSSRSFRLLGWERT